MNFIDGFLKKYYAIKMSLSFKLKKDPYIYFVNGIFVFIFLMVFLFFWRSCSLLTNIVTTSEDMDECSSYYNNMTKDIDAYSIFKKNDINLIEISCYPTGKTLHINFIVDQFCRIPDEIDEYITSHKNLTSRRVVVSTEKRIELKRKPHANGQEFSYETYDEKTYFWWRNL